MVLLRNKAFFELSRNTIYFIAPIPCLTAEPNHCSHSPMINPKPIRLILLAPILASFFFGFASKNFAADKLRI